MREGNIHYKCKYIEGKKEKKEKRKKEGSKKEKEGNFILFLNIEFLN